MSVPLLEPVPMEIAPTHQVRSPVPAFLVTQVPNVKTTSMNACPVLAAVTLPVWRGRTLIHSRACALQASRESCVTMILMSVSAILALAQPLASMPQGPLFVFARVGLPVNSALWT